MTQASTVRLILGDQLNVNHSWFLSPSDDVLFVLMEIRTETDYAQHHIQKVLAFFSAMRAFAAALEEQGHRVRYFKLDDSDNRQSFAANLQQVTTACDAESWSYQLPDEFRLDGELRAAEEAMALPCEVVDTEHFLTERSSVKALFAGKKTFLMERFYRHMRVKHNVLMDGEGPAGGRWNFDTENRKKLPKGAAILPAKSFERDVSDLRAMIQAAGVETMGRVDANRFAWPVTRAEGLELLDHFVSHLLPRFGTYQDAMTTRDWSLFHSRLSFVMNVKLLHPMEVIRAVEQAWRENPELITLSQAEGFIRQVLGWREYMRGIYWAKMPEFATLNFFEHKRPLPEWFWTGETRMKCLSHAIHQSLEHAYAHHIQRLMVTGNFALLAGIDPDHVDAWYLGVYIDALEWVEITNTRGMSQFADGGIVGSKPYVSSANYMHKMGDYCAQCSYDHKAKVGEDACPFNSLYWHFHNRNRAQLERNPRIGMVYRTWDRMASDKRSALLEHADEVLERLEEL